eukprot:20527-Heterococcus_DN1.PRE.1
MALERAVMDASSSDSDEDDALRFIPRFNNTDTGLRMEMQEAREARAREAEEGVGGGSIVDQSQFRNTEVQHAIQSVHNCKCDSHILPTSSIVEIQLSLQSLTHSCLVTTPDHRTAEVKTGSSQKVLSMSKPKKAKRSHDEERLLVLRLLLQPEHDKKRHKKS